MNPESFHFFFETVSRNPGQALAYFAILAAFLGVLAVAAWMKVHSITLWAVFTGAFYGLAKLLYKGPTDPAGDWLLLVVFALMSAYVVAIWRWVFVPWFRATFGRLPRARQPATNNEQLITDA